ncbi:MAG: hypothetical protein HC769_06760 [Cyanobacteria bacterium CRU_2_1]|nr:hypothetical protein [Cyanobacteria bacterium RU_5_0]NJR58578.1 hypothetical protein [Cyanobacteria bacterium CRU_2_1]
MATSLDFWWGRQDACPDLDERDTHPTRDVKKFTWREVLVLYPLYNKVEIS